MTRIPLPLFFAALLAGCKSKDDTTDADGDGFVDPATEAVTCAPGPDHVAVAGDCDDTRSDVHPDAMEWPGDRADSDCDGLELCFVDADGDGVLSDAAEAVEVAVADGGLDCTVHGLHGADAPFGDCDDADVAVFPGADETCSGTDTDCDGVVDSPVPDDAPEWWADGDGDGFGAGAVTTACVQPEGSVAAGGLEDCDDSAVAVYPGAPETAADGVDADCDGEDPASDVADTASSDSGEPDAPSPGEVPEKGGCQAATVAWHAWFWGVLSVAARRRSVGPDR